MSEFIPGLELSRLYFFELVKPLLDETFPDLRYDAAVIGSGSEVLGFDTPISRDHHWGPRVTLFVAPGEVESAAAPIKTLFEQRLPYEFRGYPTSFEEIPGEPGILRFEAKTSGPVHHRITVTSLNAMLRSYLNFDWHPDITIDPVDWLTFPQQKLRTLVAGAVYHTGLGEISAMRDQFAFFPQDVWLYLLAAGWARIGQEEAFVGRTGDVGDETGSRLIAGRLVRDLMQLCFLMERQYAPYSKWFGTAFARLGCSSQLTPIFERVLAAQDWRTREQHLSAAYHHVAAMHNDLNITPPLPTGVSNFHGRPYMVIHAERFADAIKAQITDEVIKQIASKRLVGSIDTFSDSTDLREAANLRGALKGLYMA